MTSLCGEALRREHVLLKLPRRACRESGRRPEGEDARAAPRDAGPDGHRRSGGLLGGSDAGAQLCRVGANGTGPWVLEKRHRCAQGDV